MDDAALRTVCAPFLGRCRFPEGPLRLAVSGGPDSMALLALGILTVGSASVEAFHVDHGLRPESVHEAGPLGDFITGLGVRFAGLRVTIEPGPNLEARARAARYAVLPADVCTGHTADDLAETVVLNLMRGAGVDGVAALARRQGGPSRPLLAVRRAETQAICQMLGWPVIDDPMNLDPRFRRVRVRQEVLPLLNDVAQRDLVPILCRQSALAADEADLLDALAAEIDPADARALAAAPVALARRSLRRWLVSMGVGDGHPLNAACIERALAVAGGESPRCDLVAGWELHRRAQRLLVVAPGPR